MVIHPDTLNPARRYFLMISCIVPRPIAWAGTVNEDGSNNLAPFSFFNGMSSTPPVIALGFSSHEDKQHKDTLRNVLRTSEITVSIPGVDQASQVVSTSEDAEYGVDEFQLAGLTAETGTAVAAPFVKECGISLECRLLEHIVLGSRGSSMILAEIHAFRIADHLLDNRGTVNPMGLQPLGRLGGGMFCGLGDVFKPDLPGQ